MAQVKTRHRDGLIPWSKQQAITIWDIFLLIAGLTALTLGAEGLVRGSASLADRQPQMAPVIDRIKDAVTIKNLLGINREALVDFAVGFFNRALHFATYFLLATMFSFLILFDFPNLKNRVSALKHTRFKAAYDETAGSVAQFALVVGYTFQAQILIAVLNTLLTALGLWFFFKLEAIALLASIVFFAGLIPLWGTFISSIPILLLAFNEDGIGLAGKLVFMIGFVHLVEAYILNPRIVSAVLKINPLIKSQRSHYKTISATEKTKISGLRLGYEYATAESSFFSCLKCVAPVSGWR